MLQPFLISILALICSYSYSQVRPSYEKHELDSMWSVWQESNIEESLRLEALGLYTWHKFVFSQPDSACHYAQIQEKNAEKTGNKRLIAHALKIKGTSCWMKGDYTTSIELFKQELDIQNQLDSISGVASSLNKLGIVYSDLGNKKEALNCFKKSLKLREEVGEQYMIAYTLNSIGDLYNGQGEPEKALNYFQRCLKIRESQNDSSGIGFTLGNIGKTYGNLGEYDVALDYSLKALKICQKHEDTRSTALIYSNIGVIFKEKGSMSASMGYFKKSLKVQEEIDSNPKIAEILAHIGELHLTQKNNEEGIKNCLRSFEINLTLKDIEKQYVSCKCLYKGYKSMSNNSLALSFHEKMIQLHDSLKIDDTSKFLQQMEFANSLLSDSLAQAEKNRITEKNYLEKAYRQYQIRNTSIAIGFFIFLISMVLYHRNMCLRKSSATLQVEKDRSENLLLNILPEEIANELKTCGKAKARNYKKASILFTDFKGFTQNSAKLTAQELMTEVNDCFEAFDGIVEKYGIEKIKTIGDSYMAAGGLPTPSSGSVKNTILAALEMQAFISRRIEENANKDSIHFEMRLGIHTGPVVAGIVGVKKFQYDVWGNSVNIASRMESNGEAGRVNISQHTYDQIKSDPTFAFESRGKVSVKGKGKMEMFFVRLNNEILSAA